MLHVEVAVILLEEFHGILALDDGAEPRLIGLGDRGQTGTVVNCIEVLERVLRVAHLVVRLGKVHVGLCQTEQRRLEPQAGTCPVEELGAFAATLVAVDGIGEDVALALVGGIAATVPALVLPVVFARIVHRVVTAPLDVGQSTGFETCDVCHPVRPVARCRVASLRPVDVGAVGGIVVLDEIGQHAAAIGVVAVGGLVVRTVDEVHHRVATLVPVVLVGQDNLAASRSGRSSGIVVEGIGVGATFACTTGIDEFHAVRPCPVEHCEVGVDGLLPALPVGTAEADEVVQFAVVEIGSAAVEQWTCGEKQCAGLDGKNCSLCDTAGIGCVPLVGNKAVGLVAELEYVVERALQRFAPCGEVIV